MSSPFCLKIRVRYSECDAQGVVFNARYADYVDLASTEFLRAVFGGYQQLLDQGYDNQIVKLLIQWQAPARFDDVLELRIQLSHIGTTSFTLTTDIVNNATQENLASAEAVYVMLDKASFRKCAIPEHLRFKLEGAGKGQVIDQSGSA